MHGCNFTEKQIENNNIQLNIKLIALLVLNYLMRVQSEYYFPVTLTLTSSKNGMIIFFSLC